MQFDSDIYGAFLFRKSHLKRRLSTKKKGITQLRSKNKDAGGNKPAGNPNATN
jgi:hypothetical protein